MDSVQERHGFRKPQNPRIEISESDDLSSTRQAFHTFLMGEYVEYSRLESVKKVRSPITWRML